MLRMGWLKTRRLCPCCSAEGGMLLCSCHVLGEHRAAACVKSLKCNHMKNCVGSGHGLYGLISCPTVLVASPSVQRVRQGDHISVYGHGGAQYQDVWHIWLPGTCGSQYPVISWKLLSIGRKGKIGNAEAQDCWSECLACFIHWFPS